MMCLCSARGRPLTSPTPHPFRCGGRLLRSRVPEWASRAPAAAEPLGFRVAHCQGTGWSELHPLRGSPLRRVSPLPEVVKPRPKPSADLGRGLPTIPWSRRPRLAHPNWRRAGAFPPGVERP